MPKSSGSNRNAQHVFGTTIAKILILIYQLRKCATKLKLSPQ